MLHEGLVEGGERVGRRGEAELAVGLHGLPLVVKVEGYRMRAPPGALEQVAPADHVAEARHALDALVRRGNHHVDVHLGHVEGNGAEGTHCVDDELLAARLHGFGEFGQRVDDARCRLTVHHDDRADVLESASMASPSSSGVGARLSPTSRVTLGRPMRSRILAQRVP
jgi:hypothetical protein